jgi:hypothetical protein
VASRLNRRFRRFVRPFENRAKAASPARLSSNKELARSKARARKLGR